MATIVLGAAGGAVAGPAGIFLGALGAIAGSYIDNRFLYPALFPPPTLRGPRLDDLHVQVASEGSDMALIFGERVKTAGNVIWMSDIVEVIRTSNQGGKGGGGGGAKIVEYTYLVSLAVAICEVPEDGIAIEDIEMVYAGGDKFLDNDPDTPNPVFSGSNVRVTPLLGPGGPFGKEESLTHYTTPGATNTDWDDFQTGQNVAIVGFANVAENNGTFRVVRIARTATEKGIIVENSQSVSEAPGASVTLLNQLLQFSNKNAKDVRIYLGDAAQVVDPKIEAIEGVGFVPAFRNTAYMVIEDLELDQFGNFTPNFSFLVNEKIGRTYAEVISIILKRAGLTSAQFDTTALPSTICLGLGVSGPNAADQILSTILQTEDYVMLPQIGHGARVKQLRIRTTHE